MIQISFQIFRLVSIYFKSLHLKPWFKFEYLNQISKFHIWRGPKNLFEFILFLYPVQNLVWKYLKPFLIWTQTLNQIQENKFLQPFPFILHFGPISISFSWPKATSGLRPFLYNFSPTGSVTTLVQQACWPANDCANMETVSSAWKREHKFWFPLSSTSAEAWSGAMSFKWGERKRSRVAMLGVSGGGWRRAGVATAPTAWRWWLYALDWGKEKWIDPGGLGWATRPNGPDDCCEKSKGNWVGSIVFGPKLKERIGN
jgi:hypothetical protein